MVRAGLVRHGRVPEEVGVRLADGNGAGTGDLVRARENSPAIDAGGRPLTNRQTLRLDGTTLAAGGRVALARRQLPDRSWSRQFPVPLDYLRRSAELAYAGNVYVSQGRTVDTSHVYVSPSLSREAFYVAMTRGRSANTAHVNTGPSPAQGQEPLAQADPLAVLAEVLDRTSSATTATEAMRQAQAFATNSGHLLTMWSAAVRAEAYAAVDRAVQERLTPAEWARYQAEPQRPVFQRQILGAILAGAELGTVVNEATARDFSGARSVAAVMHGRLESAGYRMGQAEPVASDRQSEATSADSRATILESRRSAPAWSPLRGRAGFPMGSSPRPASSAWRWGPRWMPGRMSWDVPRRSRRRRGSCGRSARSQRPGPLPSRRTGSAVSGVPRPTGRRQGITRPDMPTGPAPHGHPELAAWHAQTLRDLEIRDEVAR